jgi:hypothetical protein
MENINVIYKRMFTDEFESKQVGDLVPYIEGLIAKKLEFALYHKATGSETNRDAVLQEIREPRPLIGYGGPETNPFISDPYDKIPGAFAIIDNCKQLIYSPKAISLHKMMDAYTWAYGGVHFYTTSKFSTVVKAFVGNGYNIQLSENMRDFRKDNHFTIKGSTTLKEIFPLPPKK